MIENSFFKNTGVKYSNRTPIKRHSIVTDEKDEKSKNDLTPLREIPYFSNDSDIRY